MNENLLEMGRTPNTGTSNGGYYTYSNPGSDGSGNYINSESAGTIDNSAKDVVIRANNYSIETKPVTQLSGLKIYYGSTTGFNGGANYTFAPQDGGYGYYFQNGINTLDKNGEWYYDEGHHELYVYFSDVPQPLQVSTIDVLCNLRKYSKISISNIDFEGANRMGIDMGDNSELGENFNISIEHCNFNYIGVRAVHARHTMGLWISGCTFNNCLSGAVQFYTFYYSGWQPVNKIDGCSFTNIAPWPGMAYNTDMGDNCAIAAYVSNACVISGNTFIGIGKAAIFWQGNYVSVSYNNINNAMKNFSDYGAIYTWTGATAGLSERTIENNLIHDCPGNIFGTPAKAPIANGIYLDGATMKVIVRNNTVFNMGSSGICSNNSKDITIENNTLYDNANGIRFSHVSNYLPPGDNINIKIRDNNIYSSRGQVPTALPNSDNDFSSAISFTADVSNWQGDFDNTICEGNAYGLTNPRPFNIDITVPTPNQPSKRVSFYKWAELVTENGTRTFPARENFMPNGQTWRIGSTAIPAPYYASLPTYSNWIANTSTTASISIVNGELKVDFSPGTNVYASVTRPFSGPGNTLQANRRYIFSYKIRAESGTNGICRSYVRISGLGAVAQPTVYNYRSFTDVETIVQYLIYVPSTMTSPVFCIDIERTSGPAYISDIKIENYAQADVAIENPEDFVHLAYNPLWHMEPYLYVLPPEARYIDGFGFEAINEIYFFERFQRVILFKDVLINARPYHAVVPLLPVSDPIINITAYPNPANNIITVMGLNTDDEWQVAHIINDEGKILLTKQIANGTGSINIPVALLQKGLYFINLKGKNNKSYSVEFIKN